MRREFTKSTKRLALARSGGTCEATSGWYGLADDERCNAPLSAGVQFDHIILDANSKDNSLENCAAICPQCHKFKTAYHDIPTAAKTVRQQDRHNGIVRAKQRIPSRPKVVRPRRDKLPLAGPPEIWRRALWPVGNSEGD